MFRDVLEEKDYESHSKRDDGFALVSQFPASLYFSEEVDKWLQRLARPSLTSSTEETVASSTTDVGKVRCLPFIYGVYLWFFLTKKKTKNKKTTTLSAGLLGTSELSRTAVNRG